MLETEKAWLAGYIDGDGCISVNHKGKDKPRHAISMMLAIDSADEELLDEVQRIAGGNRITKKKYKENHRQSYTWRMTGSARILALLKEIQPYLRCKFKVDRAKLLLDNWEKCTPPNGRYSPEQLIAKEQLLEDLLALGVGRGRRITMDRLDTSESKAL